MKIMSKVKLMLGDCLDKLKKIPDNYVDSIVTDPPSGIGFMSKSWDSDKGGRTQWVAWLAEIMVECNRVLKPGGHMFVWSLPRTSHWTATAVEDGGFEIRDVVSHVFGSGFPKSHNISKGIDKKYGRIGVDLSDIKNELKTLYKKSGKTMSKIDEECGFKASGYLRTEHRDDDGWGEALPSVERWNIIKNVIGYIDIDNRLELLFSEAEREITGKGSAGFLESNKVFDLNNEGYGNFDLTKSKTPEGKKYEGWGSALKPAHEDWVLASKGHTDLEVDSKFIYQAKPSGKEKNLGLDELPDKEIKGRDEGQDERNVPQKKRPALSKNNHPTIKSTKLMSYLINMITPPQGIVLDPFMGSGSTGVAAVENGFSFIGIELSPEYMEIAKARIEYTRCQKDN